LNHKEEQKNQNPATIVKLMLIIETSSLKHGEETFDWCHMSYTLHYRWYIIELVSGGSKNFF